MKKNYDFEKCDFIFYIFLLLKIRFQSICLKFSIA